MKIRKTVSVALCLLAIISVLCLRMTWGLVSDVITEEELGNTLGIFSLLPTFLSVAIAFLLGDVVVALLTGIFLGEFTLLVMRADSVGDALWRFIPETVEELVEAAAKLNNAKVLILCALIGGLVGVLMKTGGFNACANYITQRIKSPRGANLLGQVFCMLFFFDDYANALISGPVLGPIVDRSGISRERLAYIVDSTAAPVAGIAVVSSWVAVELSVIADGIETAGLSVSATDMFISSIPYCFYCIFAIIFMLITSISGREYGPMLTCERKARKLINATDPMAEKTGPGLETVTGSSPKKTSMAIAFGCILFLVLYLVIGVITDAGEIISLLLESAFLSSLVAIAACAFAGFMPISAGVKAWLEGAKNILPTITVLLLAWSLAEVVEKMGTVYFVVNLISYGSMWQLVPAIIFVSCCVVSFATGSYGCMFMVMPMAIPIATAVLAKYPETGETFMLLCIASVLTGGIFGDHCSPMTDCTILAALGSGCDVMDHTVTQMPYALTVAATSLVCIILSTLGCNVVISIAIGIALLLAVVLLIGKSPNAG